MTDTHHILLIEDDPAVAASLMDGLRQAHYEPRWERTAAAGLAAARAAPPHLILLDVQLPDGSGFDVCRQIRQLKRFPPILMLTVRNDTLDKVLGLEMGGDDFVTKPYDWPELLARIRSLLRRTYGEFAAADAEVLFAGDLTLDLARGLVERAGQALSLSPTEFRLLAHLARHPGQVLSRAQLLDAVWGYGPNVETEQVVTVYIRRLREKVEHDPNKPRLILTVPGMGYRLAGHSI
jgi:DNA-binding response OmpR family regulator